MHEPLPPDRKEERLVLVLQGGGALGAYQAGAYAALAAAGHAPDWVAGISIGAINAAIIAGNPKDKRLAVPTEDHPMEYSQFEGVIPEGAYGAGSVIVWDLGTYRNLTQKDGQEIPVDEALAAGRLRVWLDGQKLKGGYALTRIGTKPVRWLFVKMNDSEANAHRDVTKSEPRSVLSRKTVEEIQQRAAKRTGRKKVA